MAKVITKHFTVFSRQVREGVLIARMEPTVDIILNSKSEIVGTRIGITAKSVPESNLGSQSAIDFGTKIQAKIRQKRR